MHLVALGDVPEDNAVVRLRNSRMARIEAEAEVIDIAAGAAIPLRLW